MKARMPPRLCGACGQPNHHGPCVKRLTSGSTYKGYRLQNHGYYAPDRAVWWEAQNLKTGEADFHAHTLRDLKSQIDSSHR